MQSLLANTLDAVRRSICEQKIHFHRPRGDGLKCAQPQSGLAAHSNRFMPSCTAFAGFAGPETILGRQRWGSWRRELAGFFFSVLVVPREPAPTISHVTGMRDVRLSRVSLSAPSTGPSHHLQDRCTRAFSVLRLPNGRTYLPRKGTVAFAALLCSQRRAEACAIFS